MHIEEAQSVYVCVCLCKGLSGPIIFRGTPIECPLFSFNTFHEPQLRYLDFPIEIECTFTSSCSYPIISLTTDYHNHDFRFYLFCSFVHLLCLSICFLVSICGPYKRQDKRELARVYAKFSPHAHVFVLEKSENK